MKDTKRSRIVNGAVGGNEAGKVADIATERQRRAPASGERSSSKGPAPELRFVRAMTSRDDYAVMGHGPGGSIDLRMYKWAGTHWHPLQDDDVKKQYDDWAEAFASGDYADSKASSARRLLARRLLGSPATEITAMEAARCNEPLIPTPAGYLRIEHDGIRVLPIDKAAGITYSVPVYIDETRIVDGRYQPADVPPDCALGRYLVKFFPDQQVRALLQEACGSSLLRKTFEKAFVLVGEGSNGKSTLLHLLRALHPAHAALRLDQLRERFEMSNIPGKTLILASETKQYLGDDIEQVMKSLISRDPIAVEEKFHSRTTIIPRATLFIAANKPIRFSDRTYGAARKYLSIPFDVRLADDDPARVLDYHLTITQDPREMAHLLDWLLIGAQRLLARGRFPELPDAAQRLAISLRMETDTVFAWSKNNDARLDRCYKTSKKAIYKHYVDTVLDEGGRPVGAPEFWRHMKDILGDIPESNMRTGAYDQRERMVQMRVDGIAGTTCLPTDAATN